MKEFFKNLYKKYINEVHQFLDSPSRILYVQGYSGSGKSSVLKAALNSYEENLLIFHHLCFKDTVSDDFLLSFYDAFRNYALKQVITLKKNPENEFAQKVNFYFKNLENRAVVVIDNYEAVSSDKEIHDLLVHISGFENLKVIVISKEPTCMLAENPTVSIERIFFDKVEFSDFEKSVKKVFQDIEDNEIEMLYKHTEGYELYIKMTLSYVESVNISIKDLLGEFDNTKSSFETFMIEKQISLIPNIYNPILENLSCLNHNVSSAFIEAYALGDVKQIPYLLSKFMLTEDWGTYRVKAYLKKYFTEKLTLQGKTSAYNNVISIYQNELKKSPKDRLLRLSRESIRNQISLTEALLPKGMDKASSNLPFNNYVAQATGGNPHWFVTGSSSKLSKKFDEIRKNRKQNSEPKTVKSENLELDAALKAADKFNKEYNYADAFKALLDAKPLCKSFKDKVDLYSKIALCALKLNDNSKASAYYLELANICLKEGEIDSYALYKIRAGEVYKKMYAFSLAKDCFSDIASKDVKKEILAEAKLSLGEIFEMENNFDKAIFEYKSAFDLISHDEKNPLLLEISFKAASLYDEYEYYNEALYEYGNVIKFSDLTGLDKYLIKTYTNIGVILADMGETQDAIENLEYAFELSRQSEDYLDAYYIARNIADIYKIEDPEKSYDYLNVALEYARLSDNQYDIAICLIELGDYYYNLKQNEQALICYFQAKSTLGQGVSKENFEKISTRINDMKIKLGDFVFKGMQQLYDVP